MFAPRLANVPERDVRPALRTTSLDVVVKSVFGSDPVSIALFETSSDRR